MDATQAAELINSVDQNTITMMVSGLVIALAAGFIGGVIR